MKDPKKEKELSPFGIKWGLNLYQKVYYSARKNKRSMQKEVLTILEDHFN